MTTRIVAFVLAVLLSVPIGAAPLTLRLRWDDLRAVTAHAELSPRVVVLVNPAGKGKERYAGRLRSITDEGITLGKSPDKARNLSRESIRAVRLTPRKGEGFPGHRHGYRVGALALAVPIWVVTYIATYLFVPGFPDEGAIFDLGSGGAAAIPASAVVLGLYRASWLADRRAGSIWIEIDHH